MAFIQNFVVRRSHERLVCACLICVVFFCLLPGGCVPGNLNMCLSASWWLWFSDDYFFTDLLSWFFALVLNCVYLCSKDCFISDFIFLPFSDLYLFWQGEISYSSFLIPINSRLLLSYCYYHILLFSVIVKVLGLHFVLFFSFFF